MASRKASEPLNHALNTLVTEHMKGQIENLAITLSEPNLMVKPSEVVRGALDIGLKVLSGTYPRDGRYTMLNPRPEVGSTLFYKGKKIVVIAIDWTSGIGGVVGYNGGRGKTYNDRVRSAPLIHCSWNPPSEAVPEPQPQDTTPA